jgi:hypothetical protein
MARRLAVQAVLLHLQAPFTPMAVATVVVIKMVRLVPVALVAVVVTTKTKLVVRQTNLVLAAGLHAVIQAVMAQTRTVVVVPVAEQLIPVVAYLVETPVMVVMGIHGLTALLTLAVAVVVEKMLELVLEDLGAAVMAQRVMAAQLIFTVAVVAEQVTRVLGILIAILEEAASKVLLLLLFRGNHGSIC